MKFSFMLGPAILRKPVVSREQRCRSQRLPKRRQTQPLMDAASPGKHSAQLTGSFFNGKQNKNASNSKRSFDDKQGDKQPFTKHWMVSESCPSFRPETGPKAMVA